jgi:hypothetical protein
MQVSSLSRICCFEDNRIGSIDRQKLMQHELEQGDVTL